MWRHQLRLIVLCVARRTCKFLDVLMHFAVSSMKARERRLSERRACCGRYQVTTTAGGGPVVDHQSSGEPIHKLDTKRHQIKPRLSIQVVGVEAPVWYKCSFNHPGAFRFGSEEYTCG